jgi:hypothetical protein
MTCLIVQTLGLDCVDRLGRQHHAQQRTLLQVLEVAFVLGSRAMLIPRQLRVDPPAASSRPSIPVRLAGQRRVEAHPQRDLRGLAVAISPGRYPGLVTPRLASLISSAGTPGAGRPGT